MEAHICGFWGRVGVVLQHGCAVYRTPLFIKIFAFLKHSFAYIESICMDSESEC